MEPLKQQFFNNTLIDYVTTLIIIIAGVAILFLFSIFINRVFRKRDSKFHKTLSGMFKKIIFPALYLGVFYFSIQHLDTHKSVAKFIDVTMLIILTFLGVQFLISVISFVFTHYWMHDTEDEVKKHGVKAVMPIIKIAAYSGGLFFLLDNMGFKISALVTGLGIGGVAVALAGQTILKDLFSYFAILFDRPFEIGDFVIVGDHLGTVEHVGIKTTRIKSLGGEEIILSNADLTSSRVKNYKKMARRRVVFRFGVVYQTGLEILKEIPRIVKDITEKIPDATFDRAHFFSYGDFSLIFEAVYYVEGNDYNKYMDIQQKINLMIYEEFAKKGVEFAYPTQTIFVQKQND